MNNGRFLIERHWNDTVVPGSVGVFQYFERKDNGGSDEGIG
jgi:hypothetical protein